MRSSSELSQGPCAREGEGGKEEKGKQQGSCGALPSVQREAGASPWVQVEGTAVCRCAVLGERGLVWVCGSDCGGRVCRRVYI